MDDDMGAITDPRPSVTIQRHIDDALQKGRPAAHGPLDKGLLDEPRHFDQANHTMAVMTEETFGPVLPVMSFRTEEEAVPWPTILGSASTPRCGPGDLDRGRRVASRLAAGNGAVNDVIKNIGNPHLPFGGVKQSGFGRYHGPEGLQGLHYGAWP
jgi:acyl-CoA reductase-like NAD-dependent aldehyde dehydrogenase